MYDVELISGDPRLLIYRSTSEYYLDTFTRGPRGAMYNLNGREGHTTLLLLATELK